jgi:hypothetical protein
MALAWSLSIDLPQSPQYQRAADNMRAVQFIHLLSFSL